MPTRLLTPVSSLKGIISWAIGSQYYGFRYFSRHGYFLALCSSSPWIAFLDRWCFSSTDENIIYTFRQPFHSIRSYWQAYTTYREMRRLHYIFLKLLRSQFLIAGLACFIIIYQDHHLCSRRLAVVMAGILPIVIGIFARRPDIFSFREKFSPASEIDISYTFEWRFRENFSICFGNRACISLDENFTLYFSSFHTSPVALIFSFLISHHSFSCLSFHSNIGFRSL